MQFSFIIEYSWRVKMALKHRQQQRWADEEEQERSRFPRRNNDNNGKRHNDRGGPSNQRDPTRKCKPDDTVGTMDRTPCGKKGDKPKD